MSTNGIQAEIDPEISDDFSDDLIEQERDEDIIGYDDLLDPAVIAEQIFRF